MADILPKFVVIQSIVSKGYALYSTEPAPKYIYTQCEDVFNPYVKIEVEIAKINRKYVHLRFYCSNRYWARCADNNWIISNSCQPDEDTCKSSCTLFEPTIDCDGHLHFTHVQSKRRVRIDSCSTRICVDDAGDCKPSRPEHAFSFLDWDTLCKIPKHVSFKGDNCLYLAAFPNGYNCLAFTSHTCNDNTTLYEVIVRPDGYVRIKSAFYKMFWRPSTLTTYLYMVADLNGHCSGEKEDLFWPVRIRDNVIALRNAKYDKYCNRQTTSNFLQTGENCITNDAELVVVERVCERKICDVEYRMEDARVYDELPFVAGTGTAVNESDEESSMPITFTYEHTQSSCFTSTQCAFLGANSIIEASIPSIAGGKIEVSAACVTNTLIWGTTTVENTKTLPTYTAKVPPKSRVTVNYVGTQGKCSVPFSYTQQDKYSDDDQVVTYRQIDGVFQGINSYNFNFEELAVESL